MTSDDFDTWRVVCSQFVDVDSKYDISFALNDVPEAQDSCKVRTNNGQNGLRKRPMAGVTLTLGQLYMASRYPLTPLMLPAMQKKNPLQKAMQLAQIR